MDLERLAAREHLITIFASPLSAMEVALVMKSFMATRKKMRSLGTVFERAYVRSDIAEDMLSNVYSLVLTPNSNQIETVVWKTHCQAIVLPPSVTILKQYGHANGSSVYPFGGGGTHSLLELEVEPADEVAYDV